VVLARLRETRSRWALHRASPAVHLPFHMSNDPWFETLRDTRAFNEIVALTREKQTTARAAFVALKGDDLLQVAAIPF
jgi:hypothetical protein